MHHGIGGAALVADDERENEALVARDRELVAEIITAVPNAQAYQNAALVVLRTLANANRVWLSFEDFLKLADIATEVIERHECVDLD